MNDAENEGPMFVIVPYMPKGGVGKTTTAAHLGYALSEYGKTLIIDSDPQGNCTNHLINEDAFAEYDKTLLDCLNQSLSLKEAVIEARRPDSTFKGLYLLGTPNKNLDLQDFIQYKFPNKPIILKNLLNSASVMGFSYVIFDPPASFSNYTRNIISLASHVIPIIEVETFGFDGLFSLIQELQEIKEGFGCDFDNTMAVVNKYDSKSSTHRHFLSRLEKSPFNPLYIINHIKSIPYACAKNQLLQEHRSDLQPNAVFSEMAAHFHFLKTQTDSQGESHAEQT